MSIAADLAQYVSLWDLTGDLQVYATAIGQMFVEVEGYAEDTDTAPGWSSLWDVDTAPTKALPWLAMVMGESLPQGISDAAARSLIRAAPNQDRGSPDAIANAIKQTLTGGQIVGLRERTRADGTADNDALSIVTWLSQTPDQNAVLAAIRRTVPADIDPYYQCLAGPTWATLQSGKASWSAIEATGSSWSAIEAATTLAGYAVY